MPKFELVSANEAMIKSLATGKRAQIMTEYLGYIEQLKKGQAGKLSAGEGETVGAIRRRIGAAAKQSGKDLIIKRVDDDVYFWTQPEGARKTRRRG